MTTHKNQRKHMSIDVIMEGERGIRIDACVPASLGHKWLKLASVQGKPGETLWMSQPTPGGAMLFDVAVSTSLAEEMLKAAAVEKRAA